MASSTFSRNLYFKFNYIIKKIYKIIIKVVLDDLFDPEFLKKGFWARGANLRNLYNNGDRSTTSVILDETFVDLVTSSQYLETNKAIQLRLAYLYQSLRRTYIGPDTFAILLENQVNILKCLQNVSARQWKINQELGKILINGFSKPSKLQYRNIL